MDRRRFCWSRRRLWEADFATRRTGREASRRVWNSGRRSALQQQRLTCRFSMRAKLSKQMAATVSIFRRNPSGNWVKRSRRKFFSSSGIREQKFLANDRDHHGDAAGIGPEVIMKGLGHGEVFDYCRPLVIGDAGRLRE